MSAAAWRVQQRVAATRQVDVELMPLEFRRVADLQRLEVAALVDQVGDCTACVIRRAIACRAAAEPRHLGEAGQRRDNGFAGHGGQFEEGEAGGNGRGPVGADRTWADLP